MKGVGGGARRIARITAILISAPAVATIAIILAITLYAAHSLTVFDRKPLVATPEDYGMAYTNIEFQSQDGLTLRGWWVEGTIAERAVVVAHGSGGNRADPPERMLGLTGGLVGHGYNVLLFDMGGHGESDARNVSAGLHERYDVVAAVAYVDQMGIKKIGVLGISLGGAAALMALTETDDIDAAVADSTYANLTDIIESEFKKRSRLPRFFIPLILSTANMLYHVDFRAVMPVQEVEKSDVPVLIIQGERDDTVPVSHAFQLRSASENTESTLWLVADAGHAEAYLLHPGEYVSRVVRFFDQAFDQADLP